jgi:eukaryotic-like serine/threonine-protein kinase
MPGAPASIATLPAVGDVIAGKYTILRTIGEGGMGVVYEAMHVRLRQRLAIKVLRPEAGEKGEVLARFAREARITAQLRSIHSARVIDVDHLPNGLPYIVLEYLEGCDLEDELLAKGALPVAEAVDIVIQVADAMKEAHDLGIVHRDLKPANLFVCRAGPRRIMKILDFGISRVETEEARITLATSYVGTPHYAAPEQLRDASSADARSDVWSLGVVLFELLTGVAPFNGSGHEVIARVMVDPVPSPCDQRPDLPPELGRVVLRALQRDPALRYQSMTELSTALAPFGPAERAADTVADLQRARGRLGEILVADGLIAASDLERALAEQARTGRMLGRVLLDLGLVAHADLLAALAKQQGLAGGPAPVAAGGARGAPLALPVSKGAPRSGWRKLRRPGAWLAVAAVLWIGSLLVAVAAAR